MQLDFAEELGAVRMLLLTWLLSWLRSKGCPIWFYQSYKLTLYDHTAGSKGTPKNKVGRF